MKNKELVPQEQDSGFMTLRGFNLAEAMAEELTGLGGGFERIKIPSGGGIIFEVPGEEPGETDAVKEFSAVILYHHPMHAYYENPYTGGNNPPDCGSYDGVTGTGNPGGACATCPHNQFGSAINGGRACKARRRLYVLREGEILPLILNLPTGSLKEYGRYIKRLLGKARKSNGVVTRFSLTKATNAGGLVYSQAAFAMERLLTPDEMVLIQPLSDEVKKQSQRVQLDHVADETPMEVIDPETGEIIKPM